VRHTNRSSSSGSPTTHRIDIPPVTPLTPDQLRRRQEAIDHILLHRQQRGPIGISADELKHLARAESET
jgi:hypothetical protein